jgi:hypothetical protein
MESELQNLIATDLPGRYPITSAKGHKYIFLMYDNDSGYINAIPIKSRKSDELVKAYQTCYNTLKNRGLIARLMRIDNEVSKTLIEAIEKDNLKLQIASPGDHRLNPAERAIQSFKAHFISTRSGTNNNFPKNRWDLLIPMVVLTMNMLRPSKINPAISAHTQVMGVFDFNKTPIAPAGCKVIVHDRRMERGSWADHGTDGYFIEPAPHHYRNFTCWIPTTNATRISNTVEFFPTQDKLSTPDRLDQMGIILQQLLDLLQDPGHHTIFSDPSDELIATIKGLQDLYGVPTEALTSKGAKTPTRKNAASVKPIPPYSPNQVIYKSPSRPVTRTAHVYHDGTIVCKRFRQGMYEGEVIKYDPTTKYYKIRYTDGDTEEMDYEEVKRHLKPLQEYSNRAPRVTTPTPAAPIQLKGGSSPIKPRQITTTKPTKATTIKSTKNVTIRKKPKHQQQDNMSLRAQLHTKLAAYRLNRQNTQAFNHQITAREKAFLTKHQAMANNPLLHKAFVAGAIYDKDLNKWMRYNDLIRHPNKETRDLWLGSGQKEYGRLFQGYKETEGKDVLKWIYKSEVPADKQVTYPRVTTAFRPEKEDPYRTQITAGGDKLDYDGETATHSASMTTIKTHWNSVLSTKDARYCTADCSNMYLESILPSPQFVRFKLTQIPPKIQEQYGLKKYVDADGYVYARIEKAWYGLKESGKIAHDDIVAHLHKHGYERAKRTEGLFTHKTRDISFTLVVDDFRIKYTNKTDVEHLITSLEQKYTMKVDYEATQYVGINLKWDYEKRELTCSMDGYITEALKEFQHTPPRQHFYGPSRHETPEYGAKIQYVKHDTTAPLNKEQIRYLQRVVGKFLFLGRAINNTTLHALNEIAIATSKGTDATLAAVEYFLNYAASNPNPSVRYQASDMILRIESDAAYLVCSNARSRAGGYHYLSSTKGDLFNAPIFVLAKVIKNVMASAAEAEVGALYMNAQEAVGIRNCLTEMGHPQPATPLKTDNMTAKGIIAGTIKQKRSKAMDMRFYWLKDRYDQGQFDIHWEPGKHNLADYHTKHHPASHHRQVRPIYLNCEGLSPKTMQGCIEILTKRDRVRESVNKGKTHVKHMPKCDQHTHHGNHESHQMVTPHSFRTTNPHTHSIIKQTWSYLCNRSIGNNTHYLFRILL